MQESGQDAWAYHAMRIAGETTLGAIFGSVGHAIDLTLGVTVSTLVPYVLVTTLLVSAFGLGAIVTRRVRFPRLISRLLPRGGAGLPLALGGLTALIPCGLLYGTAPLAIATGTAAGGALTLFACALGTAPMLIATSIAGGRIAARLPRLGRYRRALLCGAALIVAARTAYLQPKAKTPEPAPLCHVGH